MAEFTLEEDVDRYVMQQLESLGLKQHSDYHIESEMDPRLKLALSGGAKTKNKSNFGKPDLNVTIYNVPVLFENKLNPNRFVKRNSKGEISQTQKDIKDYALNGDLFYARTIINSGLYDAVIIVATAGDDPDVIRQEAYYVYAKHGEPKHVQSYDNNLSWLASKDAFKVFWNDATLTQEEQHQVLVKSQQDLNKQAKKLNKMLNDLQISVSDRVVYISGMLLAMQTIRDYDTGDEIQPGLVPENLHGYQGNQRDAFKVCNQIQDFLVDRGNIPDSKIKLMMATFNNVIKTDPDRDVKQEKHRHVAKLIQEDKASVTKQIFVFLYYNIFKSISDAAGSLDIMGSLYSEFLKYTATDGSIGVILTPSYVTSMMVKAIRVGMDDQVMDLAAGSGSFLVSAMNQMIDEANHVYGINTQQAHDKIEHIKHTQLLGSEISAKLYTLLCVNFIIRQDGSSQVRKSDSFKLDQSVFDRFKPNKFLLNPPFSYQENGMPFVKLGLSKMQKGGLAAVIIQDSAGSGKAQETNRVILKNNSLLASIKMPTDLFEPSAGVQTSVYIFQAGIPHDFDNTVRFIDFRNDGYKRTKRGLNEIDHPTERYHDLLKVIKAGRQAKLEYPELWNLKKQVFDEQISNDPDKIGSDFNFEQHQHIDITPTEDDFLDVVGDWLNFEVSSILKGKE